MYELISAFATQYFTVFERQCSVHVQYEAAPVSSQRIKQRKTMISPETIERHNAYVFTVDKPIFPPEYYTQKVKHFTMYSTMYSTSSLAAWSQFISNLFPSVRKALCK